MDWLRFSNPVRAPNGQFVWEYVLEEEATGERIWQPPTVRQFRQAVKERPNYHTPLRLKIGGTWYRFSQRRKAEYGDDDYPYED